MNRIIVTLLLLPLCLAAQKQDKNALTFGGSASLSSDHYFFESDTSGAIRPRRPASLTRLNFNAALNAGEFSLPIFMSISTNQTNVVTPQVPDQNIWQYFENPLNTVRISPKWGWAQFHLGDHVPRYSELSTGSSQVFGGGFDLKPGNFRFAAFYGSSRRAVEPDPADRIVGSFRQMFFGARIQYGEADSGSIALNFVNIKDDTSSISQRPANVLPEEGVLTTLDFSVPIVSGLYLTGEAGTSAYTRNLYSSVVNEDLSLVNDLITPRASTRFDGAGKAALRYQSQSWGFSGGATYVGDGYKALGYRFFQSDRLDIEFSPYLSLLDNDLNIRASVGHRTDNLNGTKIETTTQILASANIDAQVTDELFLNAAYTNFGIRNNTQNDTLKIENVSQSISFSPSYSIFKGKYQHTVSGLISFDNFQDYNTISGIIQDNNTVSTMISYMISFDKLSANASYNYLTNDLEDFELTVNTINLGFSYRLFENTLTPNLRFTYSTNQTGDFSADSQIRVAVGLRYALARSLSLRVNYSMNNYVYGSQREGISYSENFIQTSISYRF